MKPMYMSCLIGIVLIVVPKSKARLLKSEGSNFPLEHDTVLKSDESGLERDERETLTDGLCDGCLIANGVGYNPYPGKCTKYVQCWVDGVTVRALVRSCPFGQYWDADAITCRPSFLVKCTADPCKNALPGFTYGMSEYGCRGFWKCIDGFSVGRCCSEDSAYVEGMGCLEDVPCFDSCPRQKSVSASFKIAN